MASPSSRAGPSTLAEPAGAGGGGRRCRTGDRAGAAGPVARAACAGAPRRGRLWALWLVAALLLVPAAALAQGDPATSNDTEGSADAPAVPSGIPGDRIVTVGDRVKSVQKKLILKAGRLEVAPAFSVSLNDAFFQKLGLGVAATYWPADNLGLFVDAYYLTTLETQNTRSAKKALVATLIESRLRFLAAAGFQWSPIYGKIAWFGQDIIHFDMFFSAGFGVVGTTTGEHIATTFGLGQRFLVNRFLALFFKVEDRLYPETYVLRGGPVSSISNVLTLSMGASIYFPTDFEYTE